MDKYALHLCLDLDDTLYSEAEYVVSGRQAVAAEAARLCGESAESLFALMQSGGNPFDLLHRHLTAKGIDMGVERMVEIYRFETGCITLYPDARRMLDFMSGQPDTALTLITDGRGRTQRNKWRALGLDSYIPSRMVIISGEIGSGKTTSLPFVKAERLVDARLRVYVGDNPVKDFLMPRAMGWMTVALRDRGSNIHPQRFEEAEPACQPHYIIDSLDCLPKLLLGKIII